MRHLRNGAAGCADVDSVWDARGGDRARFWEFSSKARLFVVTQSALVAFCGQALSTRFPILSPGDALMLVVLAVLGLTLSSICHRMLLGASFWVDYYQARLGLIEGARLAARGRRGYS